MNMIKKKTIMVVGLLYFLGCGHSPEDETMQQNPISDSITETGELQAISSIMISVPFFSWSYGKAKVLWLEQEGSHVTAGSPVVKLDTSVVKRTELQKQSDLRIAETQLLTIGIQQDAAMSKFLSELDAAKSAVRQAIIDTQRVRYESKTRRRISKLKLNLAELEFEKLAQKIKQQKRIDKEELLIQQEKIQQIQTQIASAEATIKKFTLFAPDDGIVEYRKRRRRGGGAKIKIGDEFWPGRPLIGLPNLGAMKAIATVNEVDIGKIFRDQQVKVRLDAYPKVAFNGAVSHISVTCRKKDDESKIKVFDVEIVLDGADPILKPGMTVSCEFMISGT